MRRWEALVKFDDEIRAAAEVLFPFGSEWVDKLGAAFFALNEDRSYLPTMVERLLLEAVNENVARQQEIALRRFNRLENGESVDSESAAILMKMESEGFVLGLQGDGTITATKGAYVTYFRSNAAIRRHDQMRLPDGDSGLRHDM